VTNLEIVQRHLYAPGRAVEMTELFCNPEAVEAFARAMAPVVDPEFEVVRSTPFWGSGGKVGGLDDWLALYVDAMAHFRVFRVVVDEVVELDDDRVMALARCEIRTMTGEVELDVPTGAIVTLREGRFLRLQEFSNRPETYAAAGLT
jgi:ketosteroid isomerase-like protein